MTNVRDIASSDNFSTEKRCGDGKGFNKNESNIIFIAHCLDHDEIFVFLNSNWDKFFFKFNYFFLTKWDRSFFSTKYWIEYTARGQSNSIFPIELSQ